MWLEISYLGISFLTLHLMLLIFYTNFPSPGLREESLRHQGGWHCVRTGRRGEVGPTVCFCIIIRISSPYLFTFSLSIICHTVNVIFMPVIEEVKLGPPLDIDGSSSY